MMIRRIALGLAAVAAAGGGLAAVPAAHAAVAAPAHTQQQYSMPVNWRNAVQPFRWQPPRPVPTPTPAPTRTVTPSPSPTTPSPVPTSPSPSSSPSGGPSAPLPAALATGHPLVKTYLPADLTTAWAAPQTHPGGCPTTASGATVNAAGYAEVDTSGATNDCRSVESPAQMPTTAGYVYESKILVTNPNEHMALWMYDSDDWPAGGETDLVEFEFGTSYVSWHQAGCGSSAELSNDPWTYACKTTIKQVPGAANFTAGAWHTVDVSYTAKGVDVYYDGQLFISVPETVTQGGAAPSRFTVSEGSCNQPGDDECAAGVAQSHGSVQVQYVSEFS
jgi:hypothetical protein